MAPFLNLLPPWPLYAGFVLAGVVLAVTPGPGVLYIVTRSLVQGRRSGLASVAGVALGNLGNAVTAAVGLAAIIAVSSLAFTIVKFAGALYLVWLGIQALKPPPAGHPAVTPGVVPAGRIFRDGFLVALLNPKTAIFFAAFLPQFLATPTPSIAHTLALAITFIAIAAVSDSIYALAAGAIAPLLTKAEGVRSFGRYFSATIFFGLAAFAVLSEARLEER
jgi:threonine/homoserine/homoserine lactone efflux protein